MRYAALIAAVSLTGLAARADITDFKATAPDAVQQYNQALIIEAVQKALKDVPLLAPTLGPAPTPTASVSETIVKELPPEPFCICKPDVRPCLYVVAHAILRRWPDGREERVETGSQVMPYPCAEH